MIKGRKKLSIITAEPAGNAEKNKKLMKPLHRIGAGFFSVLCGYTIVLQAMFHVEPSLISAQARLQRG
jgi:hypothetical protein